MGASSTWYFREEVFAFLFAPAKGNLSPYGGLPIFTNPAEMMGATLGLAMKGGLVAAIPVAVVGVYTLVRPLLIPQYRRIVTLSLPAILVCYLTGVAFAYFVMLPTGLKFLLHFGEGIAVPLISITEYMKMVTAILFWVGVIFELPLVMLLLTKLGIVPYERFKKISRYVPAASFILSALITPTFDIINQTMVAIPIILLYGFGLFLSFLARPKEVGHKTIQRRLLERLAWRWFAFWQ